MSTLDPGSGALSFAPTCNLAVARWVLGQLPFDERFPTAAGEDRDWSARAVDSGLHPTYEPNAIVVHHQSLGIGGLIRQQFRYGRGATNFRQGDARRRLPPLAFYRRLLVRGFEEGTAPGALVVASQVAVAAGAATERLSRQ
jgi:GT2 family glycosyltransferase